MREIKFRAWDIKAKKMGLVINLKTEAPDTGTALGIGATLIYCEHLKRHADIEPLVVFRRYDTFEPECHIIQFTGLKDKRGQEIYEGDIIRNDRDKIDEVVFHQGCFCYKLADRRYHIFDQNTGEIIGNIWENPELLETKQSTQEG